MAHGSAKSKARAIFLENPHVTEEELLEELGGDVLYKTVQKYLIEFRKLYGKDVVHNPEEISMTKLEKELAVQLELNPNSTVIKSCIDFLKLKQQASDKSEELNMEEFIKIGKKLIN